MTRDEYAQYASVFADLMGWALAMVNWQEIAEALIQDVEEGY